MESSHSQRQTGFSRSSGIGSCGIPANAPAGVVGPKSPDSSIIAQSEEPAGGRADLDNPSHAATQLRLFPKRLTNVGGHYAHFLNCLLKLLRGDSSSFVQ